MPTRQAHARRPALAQVPLDGLTIEVPHALPSERVTQRIEAFARELAEVRFREWGIRVERSAEDRLVLRAGRAGTSFVADVLSENGSIRVHLRGVMELSYLKLTLAGGAEGARARVAAEVSRALTRHLVAEGRAP